MKTETKAVLTRCEAEELVNLLQKHSFLLMMHEIGTKRAVLWLRIVAILQILLAAAFFVKEEVHRLVYTGLGFAAGACVLMAVTHLRVRHKLRQQMPKIPVVDKPPKDQ